MSEQVKVTIRPTSKSDVEKAAILERFVNHQVEQARQVHREGKHSMVQGLCPICLGLEDP